ASARHGGRREVARRAGEESLADHTTRRRDQCVVVGGGRPAVGRTERAADGARVGNRLVGIARSDPRPTNSSRRSSDATRARSGRGAVGGGRRGGGGGGGGRAVEPRIAAGETPGPDATCGDARRSNNAAVAAPPPAGGPGRPPRPRRRW